MMLINLFKGMGNKISQITFCLYLLFLMLFFVLVSVDKTELALVFLYLMLIFWGANQVVAYIKEQEIRLTFAVKVPKNAAKPVRISALLFTILVAFYGVLELWKLSI